MTRTTAQFTRLAMLLLVTAGACKSGEKAPDAAAAAPGASTELTADAKVALDSGNTLYRAGSAAMTKKDDVEAKKMWEAALVQYRLSAERSPKHAAPYFGVYMVAGALKNTALADSALTWIRERGGDLPPGAMHTGRPPEVPPANPHAGTSTKAPGKGQ